MKRDSSLEQSPDVLEDDLLEIDLVLVVLYSVCNNNSESSGRERAISKGGWRVQEVTSQLEDMAG